MPKLPGATQNRARVVSVSNQTAQAAENYFQRGWSGILEFPAGEKSPPPTGRTGYEGINLPLDQCLRRFRGGRTNLGLRLPPTVVAIDVDAYSTAKGEKTGDQTLVELERKLGPLPATWSSTARGTDSPSRQYLFRVPEGTHLRAGKNVGFAGIDLIQYFHRYTVCWPSTNAKADGAQYRWYRPDGSDSDGQVPSTVELPELPRKWIDELADPNARGRAFSKVTSEQVTTWLKEHDDGFPLKQNTVPAKALREIQAELESGAGRHDVGMTGQLRLVRLMEQGKRGSAEALQELHDEFVAAVSADRGGQGDFVAEEEWDRGLVGAIGEVQSRPTGSEQHAQQQRPEEAGEYVDWTPQNPDAVLDGTYQRLVPTLLRRRDGHSLLYPGKTNAIHGESESGKSWIALIAVAEVLARPEGRVLYIDYEDDIQEIIGRLQALGVSKDVLTFEADRFRYVQPQGSTKNKLNRDPVLRLVAQSWTLVVVDAATESLSLEGLSGRDENEVAEWAARLPKRFARQGACALWIDHVVKDREGRGRFGIGSQHKMAVASGATYSVEVKEGMAPGARAELMMYVAKDRPGSVRRVAGRWNKSNRLQLAAKVIVDSDEDGRNVDVELWEPKDDEPEIQTSEDLRHQDERNRILAIVTKDPGLSISAVCRRASGTDRPTPKWKKAIDRYVAQGLIRTDRKGTAHTVWPATERPDLPT